MKSPGKKALVILETQDPLLIITTRARFEQKMRTLEGDSQSSRRGRRRSSG
jgi:hypothetical protein